MVIHDKSTTISCSICSEEYTVDGYLYPPKVMRRRAAKMGWTVVGEQDFCPKHSREREIQKRFLESGHFTASQLESFRIAAKEAEDVESETFICPICRYTAVKNKPSEGEGFTCSGCGVRYLTGGTDHGL